MSLVVNMLGAALTVALSVADLAAPGDLGHRVRAMSRVGPRPLATLLAAVSAILIVFGRVNHDLWWGDWVLVAGFAVLVVAGALTLLVRH